MGKILYKTTNHTLTSSRLLQDCFLFPTKFSTFNKFGLIWLLISQDLKSINKFYTNTSESGSGESGTQFDEDINYGAGSVTRLIIRWGYQSLRGKGSVRPTN